jgi:hypothetical protein
MPTAEVLVRLTSEDVRSFRLTAVVREGPDATSHEVTLARDLLERLSPNESAEGFVQRCFAFLLEREPKESILRHFDVSVIGRYFPEFEKKIIGAPRVPSPR